MNDTQRLDFMERVNADIECPSDGGGWVVYTPERQLGAGAGYGRTLRAAIDMALITVTPNTTPRPPNIKRWSIQHKGPSNV